jgi:pimeloyl-ACP methyl ester carboxylesterase
MDLARSLLGDDKINYIGYSYGTWLGDWYASLFPEHVGKFLLDSVMNVTVSIPEAAARQPKAMQYIFDNFITAYTAQHDSLYNLGTTVTAIQHIFPSFKSNLKFAVTTLMYDNLFKQETAPNAAALLAAANGINQILNAYPYISNDDLVAEANLYPFSADPDTNDLIKQAAQKLLETYFYLKAQPPQKVTVNGTPIAVRCNDTASATDYANWSQSVYQAAITSPIMAFAPSPYNCTASWGGPSVVRPSLNNIKKAPRLLMVQDQFDGATPLAGALATYNTISNANLIYVTQSYTHGVFPTGSACVDAAVAGYFLGEPIAQNPIYCEGQSIIKSQLAAAVQPMLAANATKDTNPVLDSAFNDQHQVKKLIEEIHQQIIDSEINYTKVNLN